MCVGSTVENEWEGEGQRLDPYQEKQFGRNHYSENLGGAEMGASSRAGGSGCSGTLPGRQMGKKGLGETVSRQAAASTAI